MAGQRRGKSRWRLSAKQLHCTQEQVQADNGLKQDGLPVNSSCGLCGVACQARAISCILRALLLLRMHAQQHAQLPKGQYPCQHQVAASDATAGSKPMLNTTCNGTPWLKPAQIGLQCRLSACTPHSCPLHIKSSST